MSTLLDKIHLAQVSAGELVVARDLHDRGLCDKPTCPLCAEKPADILPQSLTNKLAVMVEYIYELRAGRRSKDDLALNSYLDDPEVAQWLTRMQQANRTFPSRFIRG